MTADAKTDDEASRFGATTLIDADLAASRPSSNSSGKLPGAHPSRSGYLRPAQGKRSRSLAGRHAPALRGVTSRRPGTGPPTSCLAAHLTA